jgi:hypothetical protein
MTGQQRHFLRSPTLHHDRSDDGELPVTKGVLTIAHTKPKYATQAVTLARSIRLRDPHLPLAVATDLDPRLFRGLYDIVIPWDFSRCPGVLCKLDLYDITPFKTTLFIETDCLAVQSLQAVFEYFGDRSFAVFGRNDPTTHYIQSPDKVKAIVPAATYPVFNGGLYYFQQSAVAAAVYRDAKALLPLYDDLGLARVYHSPACPKGVESDEPLFSLAMAKAGLMAVDDPRLDVMFAPEKPLFQITIDVLAGTCSFMRRGRLVRPVLPHFVGARDAGYAYLREALRLELAAHGRFFLFWLDGLVRAYALVQSRWLSRMRRRRRLAHR